MTTSPIPAKVRKLVLERDQYKCAWCGKTVDTHLAYSLQHRRARGMGGTSRQNASTPSNLITVCGSATTGCHGFIESHRDEARHMGFNLFQNESDPSVIPIWSYVHGQVYLLDDGTTRPVSDPKVEVE